VTERDLDVVVLGATGVTGRRVAAYLAGRASQTGARWAAAARDADRAARALADAGAHAPETVLADVSDAASLRGLAARTRVVLDLVGPYTRYGRPVIEACVQEGAHYVDLTGEIPFVRRMIDEFDAGAVAAGVKVVQVCGFEALPADLSVLLAAETARARWDEPLASAEVAVSVTPPPGPPRPSDMISGGTLQSLLAVAADDSSATIADPAALIDDPVVAAGVRRTSPIALAPRVGEAHSVLAPMAPAPFINPAVIHRTAVLADLDAGRPPVPFRYREGVLIGGGLVTLPLRVVLAGALSGTQVGLRGFARVDAQLRRRVVGALTRVVPGSGYGPAADRLEGWRWRVAVEARTASGNEVRVDVDADGHPGYLATARMLGEAGLLLAEDGATPARAGCLTPALALGAGTAGRFTHAGVRFSVAS
jgi:short subunit dehydrogenase-like uncharacterized protein